MVPSDELLIALNFWTCFAAGLAVICRMGKTTSAVKPAILWQQRGMFVMCVISALSYTVDDIPSITQWLMGLALLAYLLSGVAPWRAGPPRYAIKG